MVLIMGAGDSQLRLSDGFQNGRAPSHRRAHGGCKAWSRSVVVQHSTLAHDLAGSRQRPMLGARSTKTAGVSSSGIDVAKRSG